MSAQSVPPGSSEAPPNVQQFVINVPKNPSKHHHVVQFNAAMNVDVAQWKMVKSERLAIGDTSKSGAVDDAAFYVFVHATDDAVEAYPLNDWYSLQPVRNHNPCLRETEDESGSRNLLSLMDEWINDISDSDDDEKPAAKEDENGGDTKKTKKNSHQVKPKKKRLSSECADEESNDGNKNFRESGHTSVSNDNEPSKSTGNEDIKQLPEDFPRPSIMFNADSVQENKSVESDKKKDKTKKKKVANAKETQADRDQRQWKEFVKRLKEDKTDSSRTFSSHNQLNVKKKRVSGSPKSRPVTLVNNKRRMTLPTYLRVSENRPTTALAKRPKLDAIPLQPSSTHDLNANWTTDDYGITEEAVRRFLVRKPMTTMELLEKFKTKKSGALSVQLVDTMTTILKKINPMQTTIAGEVYLTTKDR